MKSLSILSLLTAMTLTCHAALFDFLKKITTNDGSAATSASLSGFSEAQLTDALKQALSTGIQNAITNLGRTNGFLENAQVRIPMPEKLQSVEKALRSMKQDKYADEFVATMNHAAEQAVPAALPLFTDALRSMTVDDARQLISGGKDSGTQFFRNKSEAQVQERLLPIIREATAQTGVTSAYKKLLDQVNGSKGNVRSLFGLLNINPASLDVDAYVSQKASDGLFKTMAEEEKKIRENPAARTTELLQKVFGAVAGGTQGRSTESSKPGGKP